MIDQRQIVRACKARGWTIHPDALGGLRTALHTEPESENDDNDDLGNNGHFMTDEERLSKLLDGLKPFMTKKGGAGRSVTLSVWNEWMESSATAKALTTKNNKTKQQSRTDFGKRQSHQSSNIRTTRSNSNTIQVVQAYATPQLVFQSMRRQFQVLDSNSRRNTSLLGTADDKVRLFVPSFLPSFNVTLPRRFTFASTGRRRIQCGQAFVTVVNDNC